MLDAKGMKELATFFLYGLWVFGALLLWPMMKFLIKVSSEKLRILKWLFWAIVIGVIVWIQKKLFFGK